MLAVTINPSRVMETTDFDDTDEIKITTDNSISQKKAWLGFSFNEEILYRQCVILSKGVVQSLKLMEVHSGYVWLFISVMLSNMFF